MYTIFHNPRCSKSRQGLEILKNSGVEFEIREYLKEGQTPEISELKNIQKILEHSSEDFTFSDMVREKEKFWSEIYAEENIDIKTLLQNNTPENNQKILELLVKFPRGLERPILIQENVHNKKAIIGRPPEKFLEIL